MRAAGTAGVVVSETTDDRLFDPRQFGGSFNPPKRRRKSKPEMPTVVAGEPWVVLQHLNRGPLAHRRFGDPQLPGGPFIAECGAPSLGVLDEHDGRRLPACPECFAVEDGEATA